MRSAPDEFLKQQAAEYPNFWLDIERLRDPADPPWVYVPTERVEGIDRLLRLPAVDMGLLSVLAAWRATRSVYRVDRSLQKALQATAIGDSIPGEHLLRLPVWSGFVEDSSSVGEFQQHGFWWLLNPGPRLELWGLYSENGVFIRPIEYEIDLSRGLGENAKAHIERSPQLARRLRLLPRIHGLRAATETSTARKYRSQLESGLSALRGMHEREARLDLEQQVPTPPGFSGPVTRRVMLARLQEKIADLENLLVKIEEPGSARSALEIEERDAVLKADLTRADRLRARPGIEATHAGMLQAWLGMLLYLCAEDADLPDAHPAHPSTRRIRQRKDVPAQAVEWDVGVRIGAALRQARSEAAEAAGGTHAAPRAHVRAAHWHSFWTGPRTGEQVLRLRWLSPILVGRGETVTVIRPVRDIGPSAC